MSQLVFSIDKTSSSPLYIQIADNIRMKILNEDWKRGDKIPSEEKLCELLGVSRGTLKKSLSLLIEEGILMQKQGKGTFVKGNQHSHQFGKELISFAESMDRIGESFKTEVVSKELYSNISEPLEESQNLLSCLPQDLDPSKILILKRIRFREDKPVIYIENAINMDLCPGIHDVDFTNIPLFQAIEDLSGKKISFGIRQFDAVIAGSNIAEKLQVSKDSALLCLNQKTYLSHTLPVIEASNIWIKKDKYPIVSYLHRNQI